MRQLAASLGRWLGGLCGAPAPSAMLLRAFEMNLEWEQGQSNLGKLLDEDPRRSAIIAAESAWDHDAVAGFARVLALAQAGSAFAMDKVSNCYAAGLGVAADPDLALAWSRRSFDAGSRYGLLQCGNMVLLRGDLAAAQAVFKNGAANAWPPAQFLFGVLQVARSDTPSSWRRARLSLEKAADKGSPGALFMLAYGRARGRFGIVEVVSGARALLALEPPAETRAGGAA